MIDLDDAPAASTPRWSRQVESAKHVRTLYVFRDPVVDDLAQGGVPGERAVVFEGVPDRVLYRGDDPRAGAGHTDELSSYAGAGSDVETVACHRWAWRALEAVSHRPFTWRWPTTVGAPASPGWSFLMREA